MKQNRLRVAVQSALALTLSGAGVAGASDNPFALKDLGQGYMQLAEKASVNEEPSQHKSLRAQLREGGVSVLEGKCGEGRCGSVRVRQMMDGDSDGRISRHEYNQWINRAAGSQFDRFDINEDGVIAPNEMSYFDAQN
ncbi:MAG: hypothetical protein ABFR65_08190 [Pseudomonadota bacterium]